MPDRDPVEVEAEALMDVHDRNWETFRPDNGRPLAPQSMAQSRQELRDAIATALRTAANRAGEAMREAAAQFVETERETIFSNSDGAPIGDCPRWEDGAEIAAAIRALPLSDAPASPTPPAKDEQA